MFKNLIFPFFLLVISFITVYPAKKENTNLINYCYSLEKILSRNSLENSKNVSKKYKTFLQDLTLFGSNQSKGALVNKIIDQYKISKNSFIVTFVPNQFYCLSGYWIEELIPGTFQSIFYEHSKQRINQYKNITKDVDELINNIDSDYESIKNKINDLF